MNSKYDILITGGTGFLGTAITEYLIKKGHSVLILDCVESGRLGDHIDKELKKKVKFIIGSTLDKELVNQLISQCGRVIHLAAIVGVDEYINRPVEVMDVNILGTRNVLKACLKYSRPVVFASTSEIYGKSSCILDEDTDRIYGSSINNRWCYAISKSATEQYAFAYADQGLDFVAVRYFNVYGPMLDKPGQGRVISKFLGCIQNGEPLTLVDGGEAVRSMCYVDDAAEATARLTLELNSDSDFRAQSMNIGRAESFSMKELADIMIKLSDHKAGTKIVAGSRFFGKGFEEIEYRVPNVQRLYDAIGFKADIDLNTGMKKTLAHWGLLANKTESPITEVKPVFIPEIRPHFDSTPQLLKQVGSILDSGHTTNNGPYLQRFEQLLAAYLGAPELLALSNGADALLAILKALGLSGKVVLPSYTFKATLNVVVDCGLQPIFCDIDPQSFTMSTSSLAEILQDETDVCAVLPVNVFGVTPDLTEISRLTKAVNAHLIYDNAHGFGAKFEGKRLALQPIAQIISLHSTKILPAIEGGLIISADKNLMNEIKSIRNHGLSPDSLKWTLGMNSKMDEIRSAIGLHSLTLFDETLKRRQTYGKRLSAYLTTQLSQWYQPQFIPANVQTNYQNLGVICRFTQQHTLSDIISGFKELGVGCRSYFNPPMHHFDKYSSGVRLPMTDKIWESLLCLPLHSRMSELELSQIERACASLPERLQLADIHTEESSEPLYNSAKMASAKP
ncbi:MAG: aminotransferase class I/II-fold pyridoxal phosphate-dependent enzyme [Alcanivoracaceae bacterium]|nr:aminotransferase class I/II-fold pyridoxal phosphate-dependent enzyme [Alcanivoracaceae bacterium]